MKMKCEKEGLSTTKALESPLLYELNSFLNWSGLHDPNGQIYLTTKAAPKMSELAALVFLTGLSRSKFCPNTGKSDSLEFCINQQNMDSFLCC